jgi:hypothetical protein
MADDRDAASDAASGAESGRTSSPVVASFGDDMSVAWQRRGGRGCSPWMIQLQSYPELDKAEMEKVSASGAQLGCSGYRQELVGGASCWPDRVSTYPERER